MQKIFLGLQGVLIIFCLGWLWAHIDWTGAWKACSSTNLVILTLVFVQRFTPWLMVGGRLKTLFAPSVSFKRSFEAGALCVSANTLLPARAGEAIKILWLKLYTPMSFSTLLSNCLLERLLDLSLLLLLSLLFAYNYLHWKLILALPLALVGAWILCYVWAKKGDSLLQTYPLLHSTALRYPCINNILQSIHKALHKNFSLKKILQLVLYTCIIWILNYVHVFLLCNILVQLALPWFHIGLLTITLFFSSALMAVPGGLGVMETSLWAVLHMLGVANTDASVVVIFARIFHLLPSVLVGLLVLIQNRKFQKTYQAFIKNFIQQGYSLQALRNSFIR